MKRSLILLGFILVLCGVASGQSVLDKPFNQWSKSEANKILNDSPWVKTREIRVAVKQGKRHVAGMTASSVEEQRANKAELGGANAPVDFKVTLRLRSALPVRQALVRLRQIEAKYDSMSASDRAAFDEKIKGLMECPACAQNYVITISAKSSNEPGADPVFEILKGATLPAIKQYIYIANERGERRELIHFVPPKAGGEEAMFFFERLDEEDRPLLRRGDKKLIFRMSDKDAGAVTNFEFDLSELMVNGEIAF